jgi:sugar phosphate isomerase/epimerase
VQWTIGISTGIAYRQLIWEVVPVLARVGFRTLEISTAPTHFPIGDDAAVERLRREIREHDVTVHSLHAPFGHDVNITSPDEATRTHSLAHLVRAADVLAALGGGLYVIHPGGEDQRWIWNRDERLALSVAGLTAIWEACQARGLTLVVETPLPHLLGGQPDDLAWILDRLPSHGTAVCLDTSHASLGGHLFDILERFSDRLVHLQASDNHGVTDDHLPPGEGRIHWRDVIAALTRKAYRGVFMLEVSGNGQLEPYAAWARRCTLALFGVAGEREE